MVMETGDNGHHSAHAQYHVVTVRKYDREYVMIHLYQVTEDSVSRLKEEWERLKMKNNLASSQLVQSTATGDNGMLTPTATKHVVPVNVSERDNVTTLLL
jgi:cell division protein FtsL